MNFYRLLLMITFFSFFQENAGWKDKASSVKDSGIEKAIPNFIKNNRKVQGIIAIILAGMAAEAAYSIDQNRKHKKKFKKKLDEFLERKDKQLIEEISGMILSQIALLPEGNINRRTWLEFSGKEIFKEDMNKLKLSEEKINRLELSEQERNELKKLNQEVKELQLSKEKVEILKLEEIEEFGREMYGLGEVNLLSRQAQIDELEELSGQKIYELECSREQIIKYRLLTSKMDELKPLKKEEEQLKERIIKIMEFKLLDKEINELESLQEKIRKLEAIKDFFRGQFVKSDLLSLANSKNENDFETNLTKIEDKLKQNIAKEQGKEILDLFKDEFQFYLKKKTSFFKEKIKEILNIETIEEKKSKQRKSWIDSHKMSQGKLQSLEWGADF